MVYKKEHSPRELYLAVSIPHIARVLSLQDRSPLSPTYGCFHRSYWLHRTSDFPSAAAQQGVFALAQAYHLPWKQNPYYANPQILEWCLAGIDFCQKLQNRDGSFDEWYPQEHGAEGPTAYILHALARTFFLLGTDFPQSKIPALKKLFSRSALFLSEYGEVDILANHKALAMLAIYEAYLVTGDEIFLTKYRKLFKKFALYCSSEGWYREYDGADIGYLAGTINFLAWLHKLSGDEAIKKIVEPAIHFSAYFLFPDGSFGGNIGSRNTAHFYPFAYEYWAKYLPLAQAMAEHFLTSIANNTALLPSTQEDHYLLYRLSDFMDAYSDYLERDAGVPLLPFAATDFSQYFSESGFFIKKYQGTYWVISANRGGIIKGFDVRKNILLENDSGWIATVTSRKLITSQHNRSLPKVKISANAIRITNCACQTKYKYFSPGKMILFRLINLCFSWHPTLARWFKKSIRQQLIFNFKLTPLYFTRTIEFSPQKVEIHNSIRLHRKYNLQKISFGGEFAVRYVPQSRYYQWNELFIKSKVWEREAITKMQREGSLYYSKAILFDK